MPSSSNWATLIDDGPFCELWRRRCSVEVARCPLCPPWVGNFSIIVCLNKSVIRLMWETSLWDNNQVIHAKTGTCCPPRAKAELLRAGFEIEATAALSLIIKYLSAALECGQTINQRSGDIAEFQSRTKLHDRLRRIAKCTKRAPARLRRRLDEQVVSVGHKRGPLSFWPWPYSSSSRSHFPVLGIAGETNIHHLNPVECRNMWGWIPNGILAAAPSRVTIRRKATADIGAPRSLMKTYRPGRCSRWRRRRARSSRQMCWRMSAGSVPRRCQAESHPRG
jgi:hypothetical protein